MDWLWLILILWITETIDTGTAILVALVIYMVAAT